MSRWALWVALPTGGAIGAAASRFVAAGDPFGVLACAVAAAGMVCLLFGRGEA